MWPKTSIPELSAESAAKTSRKSPRRAPPMSLPEPTIRVPVDPTNPGQFFACCGLLELADRLWPQTNDRQAAEGWFADGQFEITCSGTLRELLVGAQQIQFVGNAEAEEEDNEDDQD